MHATLTFSRLEPLKRRSAEYGAVFDPFLPLGKAVGQGRWSDVGCQFWCPKALGYAYTHPT